MLEQLGTYTDEDFPRGKNLFCAPAPSLGEVPGAIKVPSRHFALLLAANATGWADEEILAIAEKLVHKGLVLLVAWGPDGERVHDLFDQAIGTDLPDDATIITTWHEEESLDEALWYFVGCATTSESYADSCASWVAMSVGHPGWAEHMKIRMEGSKDLLRASAAEDENCCEVIEASADPDSDPQITEEPAS